jgi:hypothetical protein
LSLIDLRGTADDALLPIDEDCSSDFMLIAEGSVWPAKIEKKKTNSYQWSKKDLVPKAKNIRKEAFLMVTI